MSAPIIPTPEISDWQKYQEVAHPIVPLLDQLCTTMSFNLAFDESSPVFAHVYINGTPGVIAVTRMEPLGETSSAGYSCEFSVTTLGESQEEPFSIESIWVANDAGLSATYGLCFESDKNIPFELTTQFELDVPAIIEEEEERFPYFVISNDDYEMFNTNSLVLTDLYVPISSEPAEVVCFINGRPFAYSSNGGFHRFTDISNLAIGEEIDAEVFFDELPYFEVEPPYEPETEEEEGSPALIFGTKELLESFAGKTLTFSSKHCTPAYDIDVYTPTRKLEIWYDIVDRPIIATINEALSMLDDVFTSKPDSQEK